MKAKKKGKVKTLINCRPVWQGYERSWVECRECGRVMYYDYIPYGLGHPILTLRCGHGAAVRFSDAVRAITFEKVLKKHDVCCITSEGNLIFKEKVKK